MKTKRELDQMTDGRFYGYVHGRGGDAEFGWADAVRRYGDEVDDYFYGYYEGAREREEEVGENA